AEGARAVHTGAAGTGTSIGSTKIPRGSGERSARVESRPAMRLSNIGPSGSARTRRFGAWGSGAIASRTSRETTQVLGIPRPSIWRACRDHQGPPLPTRMRALGPPMRRPTPAARMRTWSGDGGMRRGDPGEEGTRILVRPPGGERTGNGNGGDSPTRGAEPSLATIVRPPGDSACARTARRVLKRAGNEVTGRTRSGWG